MLGISSDEDSNEKDRSAATASWEELAGLHVKWQEAAADESTGSKDLIQEITYKAGRAQKTSSYPKPKCFRVFGAMNRLARTSPYLSGTRRNHTP